MSGRAAVFHSLRSSEYKEAAYTKQNLGLFEDSWCTAKCSQEQEGGQTHTEAGFAVPSGIGIPGHHNTPVCAHTRQRDTVCKINSKCVTLPSKKWASGAGRECCLAEYKS